MQKSIHNARRSHKATLAAQGWRRAGWLCVAACLVLVIVAGLGLLRARAQSPQAQTATPAPIAANTAPTAPSVSATAAKPEKEATAATPVDPQKQEIAGECADLLKMATALKTEVDKTTKDTLSVTVVRKAGEIEQLAHKVRLGSGKS